MRDSDAPQRCAEAPTAPWRSRAGPSRLSVAHLRGAVLWRFYPDVQFLRGNFSRRLKRATGAPAWGTQARMLRHLYVHVPFCLRRCSYCDFAVQAVPAAPTAAWLDAISAELNLLREEMGWGAPHFLRTLYVGGGTPSLMGTGGMAGLASVLQKHGRWDENVEWTAEANPETFTNELA